MSAGRSHYTPLKCSCFLKFGSTSINGFFGPKSSTPNGISIGLPVFAVYGRDRTHTHEHRDHATPSVEKVAYSCDACIAAK